jgi:hypothetical protein
MSFSYITWKQVLKMEHLGSLMTTFSDVLSESFPDDLDVTGTEISAWATATKTMIGGFTVGESGALPCTFDGEHYCCQKFY